MKAFNRTRPGRLPALIAAIAILAVAVPVSLAAAPTQVTTTHNSKLGTILSNAHGRTLYMFTGDHGSSRCTGACAKKWPPLLGGAVVARSGANSRLLKLTTRPGGNRQATYNNLFPCRRRHGNSNADLVGMPTSV